MMVPLALAPCSYWQLATPQPASEAGGHRAGVSVQLFVPSKLGEFERMDLANERLHEAATSGDVEQLQVT
jgi:hypothetical protein